MDATSHQREFRILGPLEALVDDEPRAVRGGKQRALLTLLLLHAGDVVSVDRLIDGLWGDEPPARAHNTLQVRISQLRKALGPDLLRTSPPGYVLDVPPNAIDAARFERLAADGAAALAAGDRGRARSLLAEALALWRGQPLADVRDADFAQAEIARLEELRLVAVEQRIEADLALGRHVEVLAELEALVQAHPLREHVRGHLMLALYRSDRQADALRIYREGRTLLADELGLDPAPSLQQLERAILRHDATLATPRAPGRREKATGDPPPDLRKTVTVLFAEVRLSRDDPDPETRRAVVGSGLATVAAVLERHGGRVEEVPGDRLMAVFGTPVAHEDDALRAVRAARESLEALGAGQADENHAHIGMRIGVSTGKALAGSSISGEVIGAATALCNRAREGTILIGEPTKRRVMHAASLVPFDGGYRVDEVMPGASALSHRDDLPLIGRSHEVAEVVHALELVRRERCLRLLTVVGAAGIGKTRLGAELARTLSKSAIVLEGRCRAHASDRGLQPLADAISAAAGGLSEEAVARLLAGDPNAGSIARAALAALGAGEPGSMTADTSWALRRVFEELARREALVLLFDDLHWGQSVFLDFVESMVDIGLTVPVLVVCMTRQELLDDRPGWGGGKANAASLPLGPLATADARSLAEVLSRGGLDEEALERAVALAEGNPLFLEQLVTVLAEARPGDSVELPETIEDVLASRLDRLPPEEARVLEAAAVVGREFRQDALAAALDDGLEIDVPLRGLIRRQLVWPLEARAPRDVTLRFHHGLLRETVYTRVPKHRRAVMHARVAKWHERSGNADAAALVGEHLELAYRYRSELGERGEELDALAAGAAAALSEAGRKALARDEAESAGKLLARAAALLPEEDTARLDMLIDAAVALREAGDYPGARGALEEVLERAQVASDPIRTAQGTIGYLLIRLRTETSNPDELLRELDAAIGVLEQAGEDRCLARAWSERAWIPWLRGRFDEARIGLERALELARQTGDSRAESYAAHLLLGAAVYDSTPAEVVARRCESLIAQAPEHRRETASAYLGLSLMRAFQDRLTEARDLCKRQLEINDALGQRPAVAVGYAWMGTIELLAGDAVAAERALDTGIAIATDLGEHDIRLFGLATRARALHCQGRDEEAVALTEVVELECSSAFLGNEIDWRSVRAIALASLGNHDEAERLVRGAVELAETSESPGIQADALRDLTEVLHTAGRDSEAETAARAAIERYELKGNTVAAERLRIAFLSPSAAMRS